MKYADYITKIEIDSLWSGRKHIVWQLDRHVNILSGVNGGGKSTILNRVMHGVESKSDVLQKGLTIDTMPTDADAVRFDVVTMPEVRSDFDDNLAVLVERFNAHEHNADRLAEFYDTLDTLLVATEKSVIRTEKDFSIRQWDEKLSLKLLSNGEKQMLTIFLMVYLQDRMPYVLFMDEPEVSLHIEWQKKLLDIIMHLNPNVQVILTTHSPAVIMDGWMDKVTEVNEITV